MVERRVGGLDDESAAVDENKEREFAGRVGELGEEDAGREPGLWREDDVFGLDPGCRVGGGWDGFGALESLGSAVVIDSEEGRELE